MVAEYTTKVTGRDLYDVLGKAVVDDYHFDIYVDGIDDKAVDSTLFTKADINRNNRGNLDPTGNGVLTQVFVDTKAEVTTIAVINTYLPSPTATTTTTATRPPSPSTTFTRTLRATS